MGGFRRGGKGKGFGGGGGGKGKGKGFRRPKGKGKGKGGGGKGPRKGGGKRSGGKGRARMPRGGGGGGFSFGERRPAYAGAPPPLIEDPTGFFLNPSARPLVRVPLEFNSLRHWCEVIGNNILAEFYHMYREARACWSGFGGAAGDEIIVDGAPADGFLQHLVLLDRQPRIVTGQRILGPGKLALKLRGGPARSGQIRSLGYIGSYLAEYSATLELRNMPPNEITPPMRAILVPKVDLPGDFAWRRINTALVPVNPSQRTAIEGLRNAVEKVQGPPGTGKSTTIFHILDARLPPGKRVLVTCSRNVAVESIAQKLEGLEDWPLCVFGPQDRVGATARQYLLDAQVGGHVDERKVSKVSSLVASLGDDLDAAIALREAKVARKRYSSFLLAFLRKRHRLAYALREFCTVLTEYCEKVSRNPEWCQKRSQLGKRAVLTDARVFLCTIASTSRMLREWEEATGEELRVHTVIVDECGCTPESSTALLLRLRPSNLVLVGDHKQLPPCSVVSPQMLEGTFHTRSLLERCVEGSGQVHQLREQYRMHPSIAFVVSNLFYAGRLLTPQSVCVARKAVESRAMIWMDVNGREAAPERSYMNASEVSACAGVCASLRERVKPGASIALLTFYRGQLDQLMHAIPSNLDVEVLTVDACQGSEFDYVVLSTVRANREQRLGFVKDPQRINVAISRARLQVFVVGSKWTMAGDQDWLKVQQACSNPTSEETRPRKPLPATFVSVYEALAKQKEREAQQKAAQALEDEEGRGAGKGGKGKGKGKNKAPRSISYYPGGSAESLMWQQGSFRSKQGGEIVRHRDGTYTSSNVTRVGGGYRTRADAEAAEAAAAHHRAQFEAPKNLYQPKYHAPRPGEDFDTQFPDLGIAGAIAASTTQATGPKPTRFAKLPPRSEEKKARKAALKAAANDSAPAMVDKAFGESSETMRLGQVSPLEDETEGPPPGDAGDWADVHEAMLFEMFPDDTEAVEETLRRFAGLPHQAARALEALLAKPTKTADKNILEVEDELDYDCAVEGPDEDDYYDEEGEEEYGEDYDYDCDDDDATWAGEEEEDYKEGEWEGDGEGDEDDGFWSWEDPAASSWWWCASCGGEVEEDQKPADDGQTYCSWCWSEWGGEEAPAKPLAAEASGSSSDIPPPPPPPPPSSWRKSRPPPPPIPERGPALVEDTVRPPPPGLSLDEPVATLRSSSKSNSGTTKEAGAAIATATAAPRDAPESATRAPASASGGRRKERTTFFDGLDGAPKWAEAPTRPEAGGKELVMLKPKEERDDDAKPNRRWNRSSAASQVVNPVVAAAAAAAMQAPAQAVVKESRSDRCTRLLAALRPMVDESIATHISTMMEDMEDVEETRETIVDLLEGCEVDRSRIDQFWNDLMNDDS